MALDLPIAVVGGSKKSEVYQVVKIGNRRLVSSTIFFKNDLASLFFP